MSPQKICAAVFCRTVRRATASVFLAIAWCSLPSAANANPPHFRVELDVPPELSECKREPDFIGMILPLVTGPVLDPPETHVLTLRVTKTPLVYHVELHVKANDNPAVEATQTEFPASMDCFEVLYRSAFRVATRVNRDVIATEPEPPPAAPVLPLSPATALSNQSASHSEVSVAQPRKVILERRWFVGAGIAAAYGLGPEMVPGVHFIGGLKRSPRWSVELNAGATFPYDAHPESSGVIHVYSMANLNAGPCYKIGPVGACAFAGTSVLAFKTIEVGNSFADWRGSARIGVNAWMEQRLSERWFLRANLDVALQLLRSRIRDSAGEERWYMPFVTGGMSATAGVRF